MRLTVSLALIVATFVAICAGIASAEEFGQSDKAVAASNTKRETDVAIAVKLLKRLRGSQKQGGEERDLVPVATYWAAATGGAANAAGAAARKPIPTWVKALFIGLGITTVPASIAAGIAMTKKSK